MNDGVVMLEVGVTVVCELRVILNIGCKLYTRVKRVEFRHELILVKFHLVRYICTFDRYFNWNKKTDISMSGSFFLSTSSSWSNNIRDDIY